VTPTPTKRTAQKVAIVGASTLLGKELIQLVEDRNFPAEDIVLLDDASVAGTVTEAAGAVTFIHPVEHDSFEGVRFAFFAASPLVTHKNYQAAVNEGATVIDLSGGLPPQIAPFVWIPALDAVLPPPPADAKTNGKQVYSSPGSAVIVAATIVAGLKKFNPTRLALLLFPPVSEAGAAGVTELETQTTDLLSFRTVEKKVFDAQVAFNLLPSYGEAREPSLVGMRNQIREQLTNYFAGRAALPAIQLVQASVFYGYAFSLYAEFSTPPGADDLEKSLAMIGAKVRGVDEPPPDNVSAAGLSEIQFDRLQRDADGSQGYWLWGVADNLRLAASNAVRIAEELLAVPA
jgi:aspartate-semialdehyde dehydrogenase